MNAKNEQVRIILACCIAEIIRIYAPTAPYKESELKVNHFFDWSKFWLLIFFPFQKKENLQIFFKRISGNRKQ